MDDEALAKAAELLLDVPTSEVDKLTRRLIEKRNEILFGRMVAERTDLKAEGPVCLEIELEHRPTDRTMLMIKAILKGEEFPRHFDYDDQFNDLDAEYIHDNLLFYRGGLNNRPGYMGRRALSPFGKAIVQKFGDDETRELARSTEQSATEEAA